MPQPREVRTWGFGTWRQKCEVYSSDPGRVHIQGQGSTRHPDLVTSLQLSEIEAPSGA